MPVKTHEIESLDDFQNNDLHDRDWMNHDPTFEWTVEDREEFERERQLVEYELQAMAGWWEWEGVRCATFGRDPNCNPYLDEVSE